MSSHGCWNISNLTEQSSNDVLILIFSPPAIFHWVILFQHSITWTLHDCRCWGQHRWTHPHHQDNHPLHHTARTGEHSHLSHTASLNSDTLQCHWILMMKLLDDNMEKILHYVPDDPWKSSNKKVKDRIRCFESINPSKINSLLFHFSHSTVFNEEDQPRCINQYFCFSPVT